MIYFDNAATTGIKPKTVIAAVDNALKSYSVNPGRGSYRSSAEAAEKIYGCRKSFKDFLSAKNEMNVSFTQNCTHSINCVLYGTLERGDHVIISSLEHNAVVRPIYDLFLNYGITYSVAKVVQNDDETVENFRGLIRKNTKMIFVTSASNVIGRALPLKKLGELCRNYDLLFSVDGAQGVGVLPISVSDMYIDYLCIAPHKGFYAPMGVGVLVAEKPLRKTIIKGGTGVNSISLLQPEELPERIESGTINLPGILGVKAGVEFVSAKGREYIYNHEISLCRYFYDEISNLNVKLYAERPTVGLFAPVISFNVNEMNSEAVGALLSKENIAVRCGLHCAPLAHKQLGTLSSGTVRFSPAFFNSKSEVDFLIFVLKKVI